MASTPLPLVLPLIHVLLMLLGCLDSSYISPRSCVRRIVQDAASATASASYSLDLDRVARLRAHQILRKHEAEANGDGGGGVNTGHPDDEGPLPLSEFMERWATSMPGVDTPSRDLLKVLRHTDK